jgi:hypothetical protein
MPLLIPIVEGLVMARHKRQVFNAARVLPTSGLSAPTEPRSWTMLAARKRFRQAGVVWKQSSITAELNL